MPRGVAQKNRIITTSALTTMALMSGKEFELDEIDDDLFYGGYFRFLKTLKALLKVAIMKAAIEHQLEKANIAFNVAKTQLNIYQKQYNKLLADYNAALNDPRLKKMFSRRTIIKDDLPEDFLKTYKDKKLTMNALKEGNLFYGDEYLRELKKEVNSMLKTKTYKKVYSTFAKFNEQGMKTKDAIDAAMNNVAKAEQTVTKVSTKQAKYTKAIPWLLLGESLREIVNQGEND